MPKSANPKSPENVLVLSVMRAIVRDDASEVEKLLGDSPTLAQQCLAIGATGEGAEEFFFTEIMHYMYEGDTALHTAAAAYRKEIARVLVQNGADVGVRNRRGAQPLHYAADKATALPTRNAQAQAAMIDFLIEAGADPNALDKSGVAPLHRAVRQRCPGAVDALLRNGAQVRLRNKSGSTPLHLAVQNTGKSGSGTPEAKACQREIIQMLLKGGASPKDRDGAGKTVPHCTKMDWIQALL